MFSWWLISARDWIEFLDLNNVDLESHNIDKEDIDTVNLFIAIRNVINSGDFMTTLQYDLLLIALRSKDKRDEIRKIYKWSIDVRNYSHLSENEEDIHTHGEEATFRFMNIQRKMILVFSTRSETDKSNEIADKHLEDYNTVCNLVGLEDDKCQY